MIRMVTTTTLRDHLTTADYATGEIKALCGRRLSNVSWSSKESTDARIAAADFGGCAKCRAAA